jgi:hypothetical protein
MPDTDGQPRLRSAIRQRPPQCVDAPCARRVHRLKSGRPGGYSSADRAVRSPVRDGRPFGRVQLRAREVLAVEYDADRNRIS